MKINIPPQIIRRIFLNFLSLSLHSGVKMTAASMLMKEIETLPEESVAEVLDFTIFLKKRKKLKKAANRISIEDAYGIFKGIDTHFEREEEDRI